MNRFLSVTWFSGSAGFGALRIFVPPCWLVIGYILLDKISFM
jgi:hypothetical protein